MIITKKKYFLIFSDFHFDFESDRVLAVHVATQKQQQIKNARGERIFLLPLSRLIDHKHILVIESVYYTHSYDFQMNRQAKR